MDIEIVDYRKEWPEMFLAERARLEKMDGLCAEAIEHIGSTAVPGQAAKPVVDIFVGVRELMPLDHYKQLLPKPRYRHVETDMEGRWLFAGYEDGLWAYNIHLLPIEGLYGRKEVLIRNFLRTHPAYVEAYTALKRQCAQAPTMEEYTRAKTAFLQKAYNAANRELGLEERPVWEGENNPLDEKQLGT